MFPRNKNMQVTIWYKYEMKNSFFLQYKSVFLPS